MRNAMHNLIEISVLQSIKKPSLFKLGFFMDSSRSTSSI